MEYIEVYGFISHAAKHYLLLLTTAEVDYASIM